MIPPWTVAQLIVEAALVSLHVGLAIFITTQVRNGIAMFRNAFYYIYLLQSVADVGDYAMVMLILRLPSYAAIPPSILEPIAPFVMFFTNYLGIFQCLSHTMISLNRYTAVLNPARHSLMWRGKMLKLAIIFLFICPIVVTAPRLWNMFFVVNLEGGAFALASVPSTLNTMTGASSALFASSTCIASAFLNVRALIAFHALDRRTQKERIEDYRLLIFALLGFVAQLGMAAFWAVAFSAGAVTSVRRVLVILMPFVIDVLSLSGPVCLLITR